MLLEIIRDVINKAEPAVGTAAVQVETDDEIVQSPGFQTSTSGTEAQSQLEDHDGPFLPDDESHSPQNLILKPLVQPEDADDCTSWRSTDVLPSPLQVAEELAPEPLAEAENSSDVPHHHVVVSSACAQTSTPEPSSHEIKDVIIPSSGPFGATQSPRPTMSTPVFLARSEGTSVAHHHPLEVSSSPSPQKVPPEPPVLVGEARENSVTIGVSKDDLPLPLTSIYNFPFKSHRQMPVEDGGQPCIQSTVLTGGKPSTTAPQRRTMSKIGSESSLATSDDSPPPSTPPQNAFEAYYIRSPSPDDGLGQDIFSKVTDIPSLPLPESDEEDDEYLLSLDFIYPDFDVSG
ncbi:hypothetical protein C0993_008950 [Termitomyces sp. T159_Od127]|nr:hypothetical protein C0993_008950 [Termitomyces sp. T159_Od127]